MSYFASYFALIEAICFLSSSIFCCLDTSRFCFWEIPGRVTFYCFIAGVPEFFRLRSNSKYFYLSASLTDTQSVPSGPQLEGMSSVITLVMTFGGKVVSAGAGIIVGSTLTTTSKEGGACGDAGASGWTTGFYFGFQPGAWQKSISSTTQW
jgi:Na+/melibiose symporter-like transporter